MKTALLFLIAASGIAFLVAISWPTLRKCGPLIRQSFKPRYRKTDAMLDEVHRELFQSLQAMVGPALHVFPCVQLSELLDLVGGNESRDAELAIRIRSTSVDFVLCDAKTTKPMLVVEARNTYDESDETRQRDQFIDQMLNDARLPLLPISRQTPTSNLQLAETVQQSLNAYIQKASSAA